KTKSRLQKRSWGLLVWSGFSIEHCCINLLRVRLRAREVADSWYYAQETDSVGPIDRATLVAILKRVSDPTDVLVWTRYLEGWRRVRDVPELAEILVPSPPLWPALPAVRRPEVSEAQKQKLPALGAPVVQGIAAARNLCLFLAGIAAIWTLCM